MTNHAKSTHVRVLHLRSRYARGGGRSVIGGGGEGQDT